MELSNNKAWLGLGAVVAALGASLCCILPVAVAILGIGSAALGAQLEPLRPYLVGVTAALLGFASYQVYKPEQVECAPGEVCSVPGNRRRQRIAVWVIALIALALVTFPYYVALFL